MGHSRLAVVLAFLLDPGYVDPGHAGQGGDGRYARALELFEKGRLAEAVRVCEAGMRQDSGNHRFTYLLGRIFFTQAQELEKKQRNDPEAAELFQRAKRMLLAAEASSQGPLDSGLDHAVGSILLRERRPDAAIERFSRAIAKAPENGTFHRLRGHTFLQLGDYEPAQRDLLAAVDLDPENHSGRIWLAEALYLGGRIEGAREGLWDYFRLLEGSPADPRHSHVLYKIFEYALAANALEEARRALDMGLALRDENPLLLVELGVLLYRLGEFESSMEVLERLLARADRSELRHRAEAHRHLGLAAQQLGDHSLARVHLEKALEISPGHAPVLRALAVSLRHLGDRKGARAAADRFRAMLPLEQRSQKLRERIAVDPGDHAARVELIEVYVAMDRRHEAAAELRTLRARSPRNPALGALVRKLSGERARGEPVGAGQAGH